jgi:hypothetical protein
MNTMHKLEHTMEHWNNRIRTVAEGLPLWQGGPGVNYHHAENPVAVNVTMLHDPTWEEGKPYTIDPQTTEALLGLRSTGHKMFTGISGYADRPDVAHPVLHTVGEEFDEETNMSAEDRAKLHVVLGIPFKLPHQYEPHTGELHDPGEKQGTLDLLPLVAFYPGPDKPVLRPNESEVRELRWTLLGEIKDLTDVTPRYFNQTLPHALGSLVVSHEEMSRVLGVDPHDNWPDLGAAA